MLLSCCRLRRAARPADGRTPRPPTAVDRPPSPSRRSVQPDHAAHRPSRKLVAGQALATGSGHRPVGSMTVTGTGRGRADLRRRARPDLHAEDARPAQGRTASRRRSAWSASERRPVPGDLVRRIVAEGHTLCNHSWRPRPEPGQDSDPGHRAKDLQDTNDAIHAAVPERQDQVLPGARAATSPRPLVAVAASLGMKSLYWAVDPRDWDFPDVRHRAAHGQPHHLRRSRHRRRPGVDRAVPRPAASPTP